MQEVAAVHRLSKSAVSAVCFQTEVGDWGVQDQCKIDQLVQIENDKYVKVSNVHARGCS